LRDEARSERGDLPRSRAPLSSASLTEYLDQNLGFSRAGGRVKGEGRGGMRDRENHDGIARKRCTVSSEHRHHDLLRRRALPCSSGEGYTKSNKEGGIFSFYPGRDVWRVTYLLFSVLRNVTRASGMYIENEN
jgi:hypothetical protein